MQLRCLLPAILITAMASPSLSDNNTSTETQSPEQHAQVLSAPSGPVLLTIRGAIRHTNAADSAQFDADMLATLKTHTLETTTSVTDGVNQFKGILIRDLLDWVGADGDQVIATALNDYIVKIPLQDFYQYDVLAATHMDAEALTPRDKGPLWIVYPRDDHSELQDIRYDYRWVWQLTGLTVE
ncbi:molybdopterin-dependent oxidoreductase [Vreelandella aquamarina]